MAELPYFPFYPADWISSPRNMCLTLAQQGAYMRLLCFCWSSGDCSLPGDHEQLRTLSTLDEHLFNSVRVLFEQHPTKTGYVTNRRLYKEWLKAVELRAKKSQAGKKSGESRRTGVQQVYEHTTNTPRTISESESESDIKNKKIALTVVQPSKPVLTDLEWIESLKSNPAYQHINFEVENGKMDAWLSLPKNKHRKKTRKFILGWINRQDKPIELHETVKPTTGSYHKKVVL